MAKKRVHEIAKERGLSSKEVLAALKRAGIEVKAPASSVEEDVAARALDGGSGNGAGTAPAEGEADPAETPAQREEDGKAESAESKRAAPAKPARQRSPSGGTGGAGGRRRRRVVIDSQAGRDQSGPPPTQRPPRRRGGRRRRPILEEPEEKPKVEPQEEAAIRINSGATVREVAESLGVPAPDLIKKLMGLGEMATLTQTLSDEAIGILAGEFDRKTEIVTAADEKEEVEFDDTESELVERPPVVTIMGHVDHGKTSLLDSIREAEVVAGEAGGITQHIGAYQVHNDRKLLTFIDTPGHQAFTAMRARGAKVTDIAVIVVAANDGVMPQTVEAIDHARAAEVPIVVAVNKIDLPEADPNRVRGELAQHGLTPEDWGGETVFVDVSAKTGEGLDSLLEMLQLVAEVGELRANPSAEASGTIVESRLDPGRGPVVTVLVQRGTLHVGDSLVAGPEWGRVRAMHDFTGATVSEAPPGMPVEVLGFDGVVEAGEVCRVVDDDREARRLAGERATRLKTEALARRQARRISLDEVFARAREGELKHLNLLLKADVTGSLEALEDEVAKLPQQEVTVNVVHSAAGGVNESDVMLASASEALIIGFNVRPLPEARRAAEGEGVEIRTYDVIYKVTDDLRAAMQGMLEPEEVEDRLGEAEVLQTFRSSRAGNIAGCQVSDGRISRDADVRLVRDGTVVWTGRIASLRRFKDDVREVEEGKECGILLDGYGDVKVGDVIEAFSTRKVEKTLE